MIVRPENLIILVIIPVSVLPSGSMVFKNQCKTRSCVLNNRPVVYWSRLHILDILCNSVSWSYTISVSANICPSSDWSAMFWVLVIKPLIVKVQNTNVCVWWSFKKDAKQLSCGTTMHPFGLNVAIHCSITGSHGVCVFPTLTTSSPVAIICGYCNESVTTCCLYGDRARFRGAISAVWNGWHLQCSILYYCAEIEKLLDWNKMSYNE